MRRLLFAGLLALLLPASAFAQFGDRLRDAAGRAAGVLPNPSSLWDKPPITTSLEDALPAEIVAIPGWERGEEGAVLVGGVATPIESGGFVVQDGQGVPVEQEGWEFESGGPGDMEDLDRTDSGAFLLREGWWEWHGQSYCLKAGTHGPGGGDGYLFAVPEGPEAEAVMAIVRGAYANPGIEQHDVQTLLWAIIARAKFEDLSAEHKATAARLLTPQQLAGLNRNALDLIPDAAMSRLLDDVPPAVRTIVEAEARLRQMLVQPGTSFAELERVAVLAGMAPMGEGSHPVPTGRWSKHPDGYYVRYLPRGYSYTVVQVYVPRGAGAPPADEDADEPDDDQPDDDEPDAPGGGSRWVYDPVGHIAVPGNTARQRLMQSGREHD